MKSPLKIAATIPVTEAEGPGRRFAVWVQGCPMRCPGCCNPHYLPFETETATAIGPQVLAAEILRYRDEIEGVTFVGGEPFSQAAGLADTARIIRESDLSVMVFSGFTIEALRDPHHSDFDARASLLSETDLLVDGPYLRDRHVTDRRWIGSANQRAHFLTERYRHLQNAWDPERNTIEIRFRNGQLSVNGFPHPEIAEIGPPAGK